MFKKDPEIHYINYDPVRDEVILDLIDAYNDNEAILAQEDIDAMKKMLTENNKQEREIKKLKSIINKLILGEIKLDMWEVMEELNSDKNI